MKASQKFFSVRYGWIKEGQEIPAGAEQEAAAAGAVKYQTKVSKANAKRHNQEQLEPAGADAASVPAGDADDSASAPSSFY